MTYRIQTKKSDIADLVPHPSELLPGELAVNYSDMVLYALGTDGAVHQISGSGGGGGLVAMDYTFWVRTVVEGEPLQLFTGTDDAGSTLAVNLDGFDVALNGVSLVPNIDYAPDAVSIALTEPAQVGDVLIVRNLVPDDGVIQSEALSTSDINITSEERPGFYEDHNLQTQQDVNWYLLDKIDAIEDFDPKGLATEEFVDDAVSQSQDEQKIVDEEQDREIEQIESRVSQIESVSLDAKYVLEADSISPRNGEFVCLKNGGSETSDQWADTTMLLFNEDAVEGKPNWDHVTPDDVIRIGGSSAGIILPTQSREADTFAEFKVTNIPNDRLFEVELIRSASMPTAGVVYGVLLLSSFDPTGLATTDYVNGELVKKFDKSGGSITGTTLVEGGNFSVKNQEFRVKDGEDANVFRVQPDLRVTSNIELLAKEGVRLGGGGGSQTLSAQSGAEGALCYEGSNEYDSNKRLTWQHDVQAHRAFTAKQGLTVEGKTFFQKGTEVGTSWTLYGEIDGEANGKMMYAHTNSPGDSDAVNYMGRMTADTNLVNKGYVDSQMVSAAIGVAELDATQEFTGINSFTKEIRSTSNTIIELKGESDWETREDRHIKVRGGISFNIYAYPGNNNNTARKAFSLWWPKDDDGNVLSYPVLDINYLSDPTANGNPVNLRYAEATYLKKEDYVEPSPQRPLPKPIVFKSDQYVRSYTGVGPPAGYASFLNAPEPGGQTNSNKYFGNCNYGIQVNKDKLKNAQGEQFEEGESYDVSGYVSVYGKEDNKLYFKAPVSRVHRQVGQSYISISFPGDRGWIKAATFGTGETSDQNYFAVIVEAYADA